MGVFLKIDNADFYNCGIGKLTESFVIYEHDEVNAYMLSIESDDAELKQRLNAFVTKLKTYNIWDKIYAIYPMFGTTFEHMKYNLKDVTDRKLRLYNGEYDSTDDSVIIVEPNYGFKYTDMLLTNCAVFTEHGLPLGDNQHLIACSDYDSKNKTGNLHINTPIVIGCGLFKTEIGIVCSNKYDDNDNFSSYVYNYRNYINYDDDNGGSYLINNNNLYKLKIGSSYGLLLNGLLFEYKHEYTSFDISIWNSEYILIGVYNSTGNFDSGFYNPMDDYIRYAGFGEKLTIDEMKIYSSIVNELKYIY